MAEKGLSFLLKAPATGIGATFDNATDRVAMTLHGMATGDPVIFTTTGTLPTLAAGTFTPSKVYYIESLNDNEFMLHDTVDDAAGGLNDIDFTNTGSGTHTGQAMVAIAGMRTTSFSINGETVDVTNKDSTSQARELLAAAGVSSMSLSAAGVFQDDSNMATMRSKSVARTLDTFLVEFESGDGYWGLFQVGSVEQGGEHNGEVTYSISLESSDVATLNVNV